MKRPRATMAALAAFGLVAYLYAPLPAPAAPPARAGDCALLHVWTNGFHTDMSFATDLLPPDHPLRRLYPQASSLVIGWGDRAFYKSDGTNYWMGVDALIPPSPTIMHVVNGEQGRIYLGPTQDAPIAISREGAAALADFLRRALVLDRAGEPIIDSPGKVQGGSYFLRARGTFSLFNVCNQWMARALRAAGVNINARDKWFGGPLVAAAHRAAPANCPPGSTAGPSHPILGP